MKFRFAAASIISMPIKMKMAWRRLRAASKPMQKSAADTMRTIWSVRVMACPRLKGYMVTKGNCGFADLTS
jgi:hypothetical protein